MTRPNPTTLRSRRWDVLVLGGSLPGLVSAIRLAMAGHRILVVEEENATRIPALLRDPFLLPGPAKEGILDPCLQALAFAPIERQAFETVPIGQQLILPDARVDVGNAVSTAEEWVAWGLSKPEEAREVARSLEAAARAECEAMLSAPLVLGGRRRALPLRRSSRASEFLGETPAANGRRTSRHPRGLPEAASGVGPGLARAFDAQVRALSNLATRAPSPEARARLLGAPLAGGNALHRNETPLRSLLRKRLESLHVEFRTVARPFEFTRLGSHPGIVGMTAGDAWLGRALVVNAPPGRLAAALSAWGHAAPDFLRGSAPTHRRLAVHIRAVAEVVPEGLARRAILVGHGDPDVETVTLSVHPSPRGKRFAELVLRRVVPDVVERFEGEAEKLEQALIRLMPFSEGRLARAPLAPIPLWDDEAALGDPEGGSGWPGDVALRAGRQPVFVLPRDHVAGLGVEGDLLLGWRAGDLIREALS